VEERDLAIRLDRLAQAHFGKIEFAAAVMRFAQQVQGVRIARLKAKRLFRKRKGLARAACGNQAAASHDEIKRAAWGGRAQCCLCLRA